MATLIKKRQIEPLAVVDADVSAISSSKISDIGNFTKKDGSVTFTGDQSHGNFKITNLGAPVAANDAARLVDVQNSALGFSAKEAVRVATTANITLSGLQTIDTIAVVAGDRVLVKSQTTASENGIYLAAAGAWSRSADAIISSQVKSGMFTFVQEGTVNPDSGWVLSTDGAIVLGTTALNFVQFSGAGQITAGAGMAKAGNQLNVGTVSATRIVVNADDIDLATTAVAAGSYGGATGANVPYFTVDAYGRMTAAAQRALTVGDISAQAANALLTAIAALATNGIMVRTGASTAVARSVAGTAGRVGVTNGDGVSGNPTIDLLTSGVSAGTYNKTTVDIYGRVTGGTNETYIDAAHYVVRETPAGTLNGTNTIFTLANIPLAGEEMVFLNGVLQEPGAGNDYTISGLTITMLTAPTALERIRVTYIY